MNERDAAKERLHDGGYTCVVQCGERVLTSRLRGVRPLLSWYENGERFEGFSAADKVVGKATAFLYVLLGVRSLYADVVSTPALEVLRTHDIDVVFGQEVPCIRNRAGDGLCPFEQAVLNIFDAPSALEAIRRQYAVMMKG